MKPVNSCILGIIVITAALSSSCSRLGTLGSLKIPETPILSTEERYALIVDPYVSMRDQPGDKGITIAHSRRGEIFPVRGRKIQKTGNVTEVWINLGKGWVVESSVQLYSGPEKAVTASKLLE